MRHVETRRWLFLALAGLAVAAVAVLAPLPSVLRSSAQPVGGATYTGEITGCDSPPCGTVDFTVSGDGSQVLEFTASDVPGDTCVFSGPQPYPVSLDIVDDSFGPGIPGLYEVSGSFPSESNAQGTLRLVLDDPLCDSGTLDWTATTSTSPSPTPTASATPPPTSTGTATPSPTSISTSTPSPTPTAAATATPGATATPAPGDLATGWNQLCYLGPSQSIEDALAGISQNVLAAYRLRPDQGYDKWFPNRPEISSIPTLDPYQSLLLLIAGATSWPQQPSNPQPPSASLVRGWNSVCYAGETQDMPAATQSIEGQFAVLYALGSNQVWQRFVPSRPEISNLTQLSRFASVLILVTQEGGAQWSFGP